MYGSSPIVRLNFNLLNLISADNLLFDFMLLFRFVVAFLFSLEKWGLLPDILFQLVTLQMKIKQNVVFIFSKKNNKKHLNKKTVFTLRFPIDRPGQTM